MEEKKFSKGFSFKRFEENRRLYCFKYSFGNKLHTNKNFSFDHITMHVDFSRKVTKLSKNIFKAKKQKQRIKTLLNQSTFQ